MKRRGYLRAVGASVTAIGSGCLATGGEVVVGVTESIRVDPGDGWTHEIPDVSDTGGAISYTVRSQQRAFDVYLFVGGEVYANYEAFIEDREPDATPAGNSRLSKAAVSTSGAEEMYEAATADEGSRESLEMTGPYYFVVDHSNYRMENRVDEYGKPLSAFVDLEVVKQRDVL